jgi:hypothetical protein
MPGQARDPTGGKCGMDPLSLKTALDGITGLTQRMIAVIRKNTHFRKNKKKVLIILDTGNTLYVTSNVKFTLNSHLIN